MTELILEPPTARRFQGMGSHQSARSAKDEWLTPPWLLARLGGFDLDPCAAPTTTIGRINYTEADDGLSLPWAGRVFLNPPYGLKARIWMGRLANHGTGIALIFARTETAMFHDLVWNRADALLFLRGRLTFSHACGRMADFNAGAPSVLVAYDRVGSEMSDRLKALDGDLGKFVKLR